MKAKVYSHKTLIGTTELNIGDESMGCVYGKFEPNEKYFELIQKYVWEFWKTDQTDYQKWQALRFNIQLENGYFLFAAGGITFDDIEDLPNEPVRIDIAGLDRIIFEEFFTHKKPSSFIEEPWSEISIEQKIAFEDELNKELGLENKNKSIFNFLRPKPLKHSLSEYVRSALCHDQRNDDVLFVTRKNDSNNQFAVVHLTWKGKKELEDYPNTSFYVDFEDFKERKLSADIADWKE